MHALLCLLTNLRLHLRFPEARAGVLAFAPVLFPGLKSRVSFLPMNQAISDTPEMPEPGASRPVILLAGATGLVGSAILRRLAQESRLAQVRTLTRRPLPLPLDLAGNSRLVQCIEDFERLDRHPDWFQADSVICALGTTMRKAGSAAAFRRVDFDYPLAIASMAAAHGASHFLLVSAMGADAQSGNFYYRVKGELEDAVLGLGYAAVTIARPSLLLGPRTEWRWGEEFGKRLAWLLPARWRPVAADSVAAALVRAAHSPDIGVRILENAALRT